MTDYTQEQAERIGREAVALGMPWRSGMRSVSGMRFVEHADCGEAAWVEVADDGCVWAPIRNEHPDPRDPLTRKAFELWVEGVAAEFFGEQLDYVCFITPPEGQALVQVEWWSPIENDLGETQRDNHCDEYYEPTGPEACIEAVKAMREGE